MDKPVIKVITASAEVPASATPTSAGADIRAFIEEDITIAPGARALIPTGLRVELPVGYEMQIRPRSGLALKHGITVLNSPGTIDADYRGEIGVILINLSDKPFTVSNGDRIAQAVVAAHATPLWMPADKLSDTSRADGGFGHTGIK